MTGQLELASENKDSSETVRHRIDRTTVLWGLRSMTLYAPKRQAGLLDIGE